MLFAGLSEASGFVLAGGAALIARGEVDRLTCRVTHITVRRALLEIIQRLEHLPAMQAVEPLTDSD